MRLLINSNEILCYEDEGVTTEVNVKQCFPWSHPEDYLSLRGNNGKEVAMIEKIDDLSIENREVLSSYLTLVKFVIEVTSVVKIEEDVELRIYTVRTKSGDRIFQTKLEDWPTVKSSGEVLIQDLSGDLFQITNIKSLDQGSLQMLSPYIN